MRLSTFKNALLVFICLLFCKVVCAQAGDELDNDIYWQVARASLPDLKDLLAIPNDAHFPEDIEANVQWCEGAFGLSFLFETKRLETPGAPLLLASEANPDPTNKTVLVYLQVDGQPVDSTFWFQPDPYQATLKQQSANGGWEILDWKRLFEGKPDFDWRIFGRSTADSKGAVVMFLTAMKMLRSQGVKSNFNIKVIMDFEEEIGSPNLPAAVERYREELAADMLVIFDGPRHLSNQPTLTFGARGITEFTLKVFGPRFPQHSGHYGNWAPNPAERLAQLIASMKRPDGTVSIPGFYDGIEVAEDVRATMREVPDDEQRINYELGVASATKVAPTYQESLQYPSLNVKGFLSGWVGAETRNIVPASATAEMDIRLVLENDPERLLALVRKHIEGQGYFITEDKPTARERLTHERICQFNSVTSYLAFRTDFDSPVGIWLDRALTKAFGRPPVKQRTSGGSIPISPFVNILGIPAVSVPLVNSDNNQHAPNENVRLGNYVDGIKTVHAILTEEL